MNIQKHISVYILCGGKSSRMQTEKGLVVFKNKPFIEWILEAVKPISNQIFLITENTDYSVYNYPLIADIYKNKGPVGGIHTALSHTSTQQNLILSCDIPMISTHIINRYLIHSKVINSNIAFVSDRTRDYPLIGMYSTKNLERFEVAIQQNHLKLMHLIQSSTYHRIQVAARDFDALYNINTQAELQTLIQRKL
ncbi:molybdenum cofactor guanylyltransferase [Formosa sediminum]|uniref:Probable molybdenum cofactor guanylyltransferase n=1 Tax=Formosa sediminum TaxID=2594004 RepID=A0A516GQW1_9FLAO|nr:molybdenum cofactor guanylyltransferase [Formosa sediminum]QDO93889.1 molybdenum cofactor guanylyltransferase [Formosa sediminum]